MLHEDRGRAESFGDAAERYDRARPSYPPALVDDLTAGTTRRVLDVGCGTGIASRLFTARGCAVVGVEQDARMAEVARRHGIDVEVASFETWDARDRTFDLVACGQAWHWIDPDVGPVRAGSVLVPGGRWAAFWNRYHHEPDVFASFREVHRAAGVAEHSIAMGGTLPRDLTSDQRAADVAAVDRSGLFEPVEERGYAWDRAYGRDEWIDDLSTHSGYATLPADVLRGLLDGIGAAVDRLGGRIVVHMATELLTAVRRG